MERFEAPDELLVVAAILGNLEAFEQLVVRYRPAVVRLARTIVGPTMRRTWRRIRCCSRSKRCQALRSRASLRRGCRR